MRSNLAWLMAASMLAVGACGGDGDGGGGDCPTDPLQVGVGGCLSSVDPTLDSDNDGVTDVMEGTGDANGNGYPAHRDPTEQGSVGSVGMGDAGGGDSSATGGDAATGLPSQSPCDATSVCADVVPGFVTGCCAANGTCGGMNPITSTCQAGVACGQTICSGDNPCCNAGVCGELATDGVTCMPKTTVTPDAGAQGDGGFTVGQDGGVAVSDCSSLQPIIDQVAGPGAELCCASDGTCGGLVFGTCLSVASFNMGGMNVSCTPGDVMP